MRELEINNVRSFKENREKKSWITFVSLITKSLHFVQLTMNILISAKFHDVRCWNDRVEKQFPENWQIINLLHGWGYQNTNSYKRDLFSSQ